MILIQFLETLDEYEKKEEQDRLAHGNVSKKEREKADKEPRKELMLVLRRIKSRKPRATTKPAKEQENNRLRLPQHWRKQETIVNDINISTILSAR